MSTLRSILVCALLLALIGLTVSAIVLVHTATVVVESLPRQVEAARRDLASRVDAALATAGAGVNRQATGLRADLTSQVAGIRADLMPRVDALIVRTDARVGEAIQVADSRLGETSGAIVGIRQDLKPTLLATAVLETDAQASWDDLYWDLKATVESGTVTMHSVALASEAVEAAAPQLAAAAVANGKNMEGITADVHTATSEYVKPKSTWQKIKSALWLIAYGAAHAL